LYLREREEGERYQVTHNEKRVCVRLSQENNQISVVCKREKERKKEKKKERDR
jgi:protease II